MNARKLIAAVVTAVVALAMAVPAIPVASVGMELFTWLVGTSLIATALVGVRTPWRASRRIKTHPLSTVKQKVPSLGSNCYVGCPIQGSHEKQLTTYCLA